MEENGGNERDQDLRKAVYDATWGARSWGRNDAVALGWRMFRSKTADAASGLSSTLYSAANNAIRVRVKQARGVARYLWLVRGMTYLFYALLLSEYVGYWDRRERKEGRSGATTSQLDVRSRILCAVRRYRAAAYCAKRALGQPDLSTRNRVLLLLAAAEPSYRLGLLEARRYYEELQTILSERSVDATAAVRGWKALWNYYRKEGRKQEADGAWTSAVLLARQDNLQSQLDELLALGP